MKFLSYRVSESIYKDPNGFKVFVEIEFNKEKLFEVWIKLFNFSLIIMFF